MLGNDFDSKNKQTVQVNPIMDCEPLKDFGTDNQFKVGVTVDKVDVRKNHCDSFCDVQLDRFKSMSDSKINIDAYCSYLNTNRSVGIPQDCVKYVGACGNTIQYDRMRGRAMHEVLTFMKESTNVKFKPLLQPLIDENGKTELQLFCLLKAANRKEEVDRQSGGNLVLW